MAVEYVPAEEVSQAQYTKKFKEDIKSKDGIFLVAEEYREIAS